MEVEQNIPVTPPQEEVKTPPKNGKDKNIWIIILNVFLALITIALLGYIAYKNGYVDLGNIFNNAQEESEEEEQEEETEPEEFVIESNGEETLVTFEGEYLSLIHPEGWTVEEYLDGVGSDMLVEGVTYTGLTGLKIFTDDDLEILNMYAVSGIGFVGCPELPIFDDSSDTYLTEQQDMNDEVGVEMITLDYTDTEYVDFEWLGKGFRRVNTTLYFDTELGNDTFEPQCEAGLITVPGLGFEDSDGYEGVAYFYGISEEATDEELETLDQVLTSMVVN